MTPTPCRFSLKSCASDMTLNKCHVAEPPGWKTTIAAAKERRFI